MLPDSTLPVIHHAAYETHSGPDYFFDNRLRGGPRILVIQQTRAGSAFLSRPEGSREVPTDHAMLFYHGEHSSYGFPPGAATPYCTAYLCLLGHSAETHFHELVRRFGAVVPLRMESHTGRLFEEAVSTRIHQSFRDRFHQAEMIYRLLLALHRDLAGSAVHLDPAAQLHETIQNHFHRAISIKAHAAEHRISREHLSRLFAAQYGEPPGRLLRRLRLERARLLLESTSLPVAEIASNCGYPDPNVFSRSFRHYHGLPPRLARRQSTRDPHSGMGDV